MARVIVVIGCLLLIATTALNALGQKSYEGYSDR